jgi:murein DD-endopeptidase MepM/ murein hydrolase activator NlpD
MQRRFFTLFLSVVMVGAQLCVPAGFLIAQNSAAPDASVQQASEDAARASEEAWRARDAAQQAEQKAKKDALKGQIDAQQAQIDKLEDEIREYEKELTKVGASKKTLASTIRQIDILKKRAQAAISATQGKIKVAEQRITDLGTQIVKKGQSIQFNSAAATFAMRSLQQHDEETFMEQLLQQGSLGEVWNAGEQLEDVQSSISTYVGKLKQEKKAIQDLKTINEGEKKNLTVQQRDHTEKKRGLEAVEEEKRVLLTQTKNKETEYQMILRLKREAKEEFENQLRSYESQLKFVLDQASIPKSGSGALAWPLKKVTITQRFGQTAFAKGGAYNGKGHNGVDFGTPTGTPVFSAADGLVEASGNTDAHPGCYSYGKWVLIRHTNGLSSLYGHLSQISASVGSQIGRGDTLGYSGNTGYSTGPHLHFTVLASSAVKVVRMADIGSKSGCRNASIPVAATSGYLNPLDYL